jgi:predicted metal-binding membrane protein
VTPAIVVVAAAWAAAVGADVTGLADGVHHDRLFAGGLSIAAVGAFVLVWQLHLAAVMLPTSLAMISRFGVVVASRPRPTPLQGAFLSGYVAVWTYFALVALTLDAVVHRVVGAWTWLDARPGLVLGGVLFGAGLYQFSGLKARCLHACRRPDTFLRLHYRRGLGAAVALGVRHGVFCVGCCWALMLVMFAVGLANIVWMAPLALLMLVEKSTRWGEQVVAPAGGALTALGLGLGLAAVFP